MWAFSAASFTRNSYSCQLSGPLRTSGIALIATAVPEARWASWSSIMGCDRIEVLRLQRCFSGFLKGGFLGQRRRDRRRQLLPYRKPPMGLSVCCTLCREREGRDREREESIYIQESDTKTPGGPCATARLAIQKPMQLR